MQTSLSDAKRTIDDLEMQNHRIGGDRLLIANSGNISSGNCVYCVPLNVSFCTGTTQYTKI